MATDGSRNQGYLIADPDLTLEVVRHPKAFVILPATHAGEFPTAARPKLADGGAASLVPRRRRHPLWPAGMVA